MERKDVFLESKIQTPAASRNFLIRERLIQQLNGARERLAIISAGMGYGKTVLLTHFAKRYPDKCAWYHLDRTDNDIMVFVGYLSRSVARVAPEFEVDFSPYLQMEQNEALVRNLALDFAESFRLLGDREICLVLDDFQVVESEWVFLFLNVLWDSDHGELRLFLCTKSAPPAFCAKYLMEQRAVVMGADSLSFNLEEIRLLARDYAAPEQLDAVARAIQTRIEGWPAGVSFALLYFRQQQCRMTEQELEQACQQRYLQDYFMHELFRKLPFELQRFLTCTSVLTYLRPDVCNALVGIDNAAGQLAYLEQENLFILRLSGSGRIYRYHSLFRHFLIGQLPPAQRVHLLEQASDFYLRAPEKAQAAEYAIACGDGDRLQSAVEAAGPEVLARGQLDTLHRWLEELRTLGTEPSPEVLVLEAQYRERTGDWQEALDLADRAAARQPEGGERCWIEARLVWARVTREQVSVRKSLEILDEVMGRLAPERAALRPLRRQAAELRIYDLLDLGEFSPAMEQVLDGLEKSALRRDAAELAWNRELAALCFFASGDYRRSVRMCVVLGSDGPSGVTGDLMNVYLALSGRARQARERMSHAAEEPPEGAPCFTSELMLLRILVERMAALEGGEQPGTAGETPRSLWDENVLWSRFSGQRSGTLIPVLRRALSGEAMDAGEEEALFAQDSQRFTTMQDGARWLAVRNAVRRGDRQRALELCRRARAARAAWCGENGAVPRRINAFLGYIGLEEALLAEPADAAALMDQCGPYLLKHRLVCPGLTREESLRADRLLAHYQTEPQAPLTPEESAERKGPAQITVKCFGRLHVLLPDGQELHWRTRKAGELFAYLFHLSGAAADREQLIDLLWPQASPSNATSLFHTSLYSIRKTLASYGLDGLFQREQHGYRMEMSMVCSPRPAVDALCRGEEAEGKLTELYEGPYLEDVEAPWAEDSRAWYAGAFLHACRTQALRCMDAGDCPTAAEYLRAAVRQEPYDEEIAGQLIRCYAAMGETRNAIAQYSRLKTTLAEELDTEPGEEIRRIYEECLLKRLKTGRSTE